MQKPNFNSKWLHLGCGLNAPSDWLNVDGSAQVWFAKHPKLKSALVALKLLPKAQAELPWPTNVMRADLRKSLPFESDRFTAVYSSHTFEHLYREQALALAKECYRVLCTGGVCRIVVPDIHAAIQRYLVNKATDEQQASDLFMEEILVHPSSPYRGALGTYHRLTAFHQHKWMYDAGGLRRLMQQAGFNDVKNAEYSAGRMQGIDAIESPSRVMHGAGVVAEGIK